MKRLSFGFVLLAVLLAACTGTSEPPLNLLLAVGSGSRVYFYPAGVDDRADVGYWDLGDEVLDLARPVGEERLWVLTSSSLAAYPVAGGGLDRAPQAGDALVSLALPADCDSGRLRIGESHLLIDCGAGAVWLTSLSDPALVEVETSEDADGTIYLLGPDDRLTRVVPALDGFDLYFPADEEEGLSVTSPVNVDHLLARWNADELLVALDSGSDVRLYVWQASSADPPQPSGDPLLLTGARALVPCGDGCWLVGGDSGYVLRRSDEDDVVRYTPVELGLVSPNQYAYLAADGRLTVLDLLDPLLSEHARTFPAAPRGMVWLPVGE